MFLHTYLEARGSLPRRTALALCAVVPVSAAPAALAGPVASPAPRVPQSLGTTVRVSVTASGAQSAGPTQPELRGVALSEDGRFIAFTSRAADLVPGDGNGLEDVFLRDTLLGTTVRVSGAPGGADGNGFCRTCDVSDDGRFVVFSSAASNLTAGDSNGNRDVFLRDVALGTTTLVSRALGGGSGDGISRWPSVSGDGAVVVFQSAATDLVPGDTNAIDDVFAYDVAGGTLRALSRGPGGAFGNGESSMPHVSRDGAWAAFESTATNLGPADTSVRADVYLAELATGQVVRVEGPNGELDARSARPRISADGRFVAFESQATNLVLGGNVNGTHIARWDRLTGALDVVTRDLAGNVSGGVSGDACVSSAGELVAFRSFESDLVTGDTNGREDVFVRHVSEGWTERVSVTRDGAQIVGWPSRAPALSGDGRFAAFTTGSEDVVQGDDNGAIDVFRRDRVFGEGVLAVEYCASTVNSSGAAAVTVAVGTPLLSAQDLTLGTVGLPPNQFGFYLTSPAVDLVPGFGGSAGVLCVGAPIVRLDAFILNSGSLGRVDLPLPFAQVPPAAAFTVGTRWNFQYWFRDPAGGALSNTSSAIAVVWR
ncbi:MAG: hypothetical protein AAFP22_00160 [Planctomycetota bacterium]